MMSCGRSGSALTCFKLSPMGSVSSVSWRAPARSRRRALSRCENSENNPRGLYRIRQEAASRDSLSLPGKGGGVGEQSDHLLLTDPVGHVSLFTWRDTIHRLGFRNW